MTDIELARACYQQRLNYVLDSMIEKTEHHSIGRTVKKFIRSNLLHDYCRLKKKEDLLKWTRKVVFKGKGSAKDVNEMYSVLASYINILPPVYRKYIKEIRKSEVI